MRLVVVLALLAGCDRSDDPPPSPPPSPEPPPVPQKRKPADRTITYDPYAVGADAEPEDEPRLPPTPPGELDAERGKLVVAELNELCGDIWCEGEYSFTFTSMTCVRGACQLAFEAKHHESEKAFTDTIKFDFFDRAADSDGTTPKLHRAIGAAIRVWERRHKR